MPLYEREAIAELQQRNRELQHDLQVVTDKLHAETERATLALKSAADAWAFARVVLRTGRAERRRP